MGPLKQLALAAGLCLSLWAGALRPATGEEAGGDLVSGDTAYGQEAGEWEFALETLYTDAADEDEWEVRFGLEYGVTDRLQLALDIPYLFVNPKDPEEPPEDGFDLVELALQYALLGEEAPVALSLEAEAGFPVAGRDGPGDDDVRYALAVLAAKTMGQRELYGALKATWSDGPTEYEAEAGVVFAFERTAWEIQVTWTDERDRETLEVRPEFVVEDVGPLDLAIGLPYVFTDGRDEWGASVELTYGWP